MNIQIKYLPKTQVCLEDYLIRQTKPNWNTFNKT